MTTESPVTEFTIYEKNLQLLLAEYERVHSNYINSLRAKNITESSLLLEKIQSLNQQIQSLSLDMSNKIHVKGEYTDDIDKKKDELNTLHNKMIVDETKIKNLLNDTIDLDGQNETLRLQHKSSMYYNSFYIIIIILISILIFRIFISTEADPLENILLILAIVLLLYIFWSNIKSALHDIVITNMHYDSSSFLYRMLN